MKKWLGVIAGAAVLLGACGGGTTEKSSTSTASKDVGYEVYSQKSCIGCHGKDLEGGSGPNLTKVGAKYSKSEILDIIKNGKGAMPKGQAEGSDAEKIAAFLAKQK